MVLRPDGPVAKPRPERGRGKVKSVPMRTFLGDNFLRAALEPPLILLILLFTIGAAQVSFALDWKLHKSHHVLVYYLGHEEFAKEVAKAAEDYYKDIADILDFPRYKDFWLWEKRAKIYLYKDRDSYLQYTGSPQWSGGCAYYDKREIHSFQDSPQFLDSILPHELTHLIFREFMGPGRQIPLWLDEGVACYQEKTKRMKATPAMKVLVEEGKHIPIETLAFMRLTKDIDSETAGIFYLEATSLVEFLIERFGRRRFGIFCRQLRDEKNLEEALTFAYPTAIRSLQDLERAWVEYVEGSEFQPDFDR